MDHSRRTLTANEQALLDASRWRALHALLPTLTHGLRAPLNGVVVNLELLKELLKPDVNDDDLARDRRRRSVEALDRSVTGLRRVLDEFIAGLAEPTDTAAARFGLRDVVEEVVELARPRATVQHAVLKLAPPADAAVEAVRGDVKHALVNLILEALDSAPPEGEIAVELRREGDAAVVSVETMGTDENLSGDGATDEGDEAGERLLVASAIAAANGGALRVSKTDGGVCTEFSLPAAV